MTAEICCSVVIHVAAFTTMMDARMTSITIFFNCFQWELDHYIVK